MKILIRFLLIGISLCGISACQEETTDPIFYNKIKVINNTDNNIKLYAADTLWLKVSPHEATCSDFEFGEKFFWGSNHGLIVADSVISLPYENNYMSLQDFYTEEEYESRKYINTFIIDDEWICNLWRYINTND